MGFRGLGFEGLKRGLVLGYGVTKKWLLMQGSFVFRGFVNFLLGFGVL